MNGIRQMFHGMSPFARAIVGGALLWSLCGAAALIHPGPSMAMDQMEHGGAHGHAAAPGSVAAEEVTCALDGMTMRPTADTPSLEYRGKRYYFCSDGEKRAFQQDPERYVGK